MIEFHTPSNEELAFLRITTARYPELQAQVESCEVADYDPDGYCDLRVLAGPPSPVTGMLDGPSLLTGDPTSPLVDTILWVDDERKLYKIEVVEYGADLGHVYQRYIHAAAEEKLLYKDGM